MRIRQLAAGLWLATAFAVSAEAATITEVHGPDGPWDYATFDSVHHRVLIARGDGVESLAPADMALAHFALGSRVHGIVVLPSGDLVVTNGKANTVTLVDGRTRAVRTTIPVGTDPDAAVYDPATRGRCS